MRSLIRCAAILMCMLIGLTACSARQAPDGNDGKTVLEYWVSGDVVDVFDEIVTSFNAQSDDVRVILVRVDESRIESLLATGKLPQLVTVEDEALQAMIDMELCASLDERFSGWEDNKSFSDWYIEGIRGFSANARLYAVPQAVNVPCLWYRRDVFEANSIDPPESWDAFFQAAEALTNTSGKVYGYTLRGGAGSMEQYLHELVSYVGAGSFYSVDGEAALLRSEEALEYTAAILSLYKSGFAPASSVSADHKSTISDFDAGVAMTLIHNLSSYSNHRANLKPEQIGVLPLPIGMTGQRFSAQPAYLSTVVVAGNEELEDAAWQFVAYASSSQSIAEISDARGWLASRSDSISLMDGDAAEQLEALAGIFAQGSVTVTPLPSYLPDYARIAGDYGDSLFEQMLTENLTPEEFLDILADAFEEAYA